MSFYYYFYVPIVEWGVIPSVELVLVGLFYSVGLPFLALAFVLPVVIVNEMFVKKASPLIRRVARSLGAKFETPEAEMEALI